MPDASSCPAAAMGSRFPASGEQAMQCLPVTHVQRISAQGSRIRAAEVAAMHARIPEELRRGAVSGLHVSRESSSQAIFSFFYRKHAPRNVGAISFWPRINEVEVFPRVKLMF